MKKFIKSLFSGVIVTSVLLNSINVFASQTQVVKISVGNTIANVNGNDTTLSIAPYIQKSSGAMMIPLRFVSTSLGIDENNIKYNPNTKEISIAYNGKTVKFIVGTNKLIIDGKDFSMLLENKYPIYTEIKNGSTFIPLRSLELAFDNIKIDWENSTKTAILKNELEEKTQINSIPILEISKDKEIEVKQNIPNLTTEERIKQEELLMVQLVNEERAKYDLQPLQISDKLMKTSKEKAEDMAKNNYYSHTSPNGYNMARDLNVAENINLNGGGAEGNMSDWLNSKGHRNNILNKDYKYIGVAISQSDDGTFYAVQQFSDENKWAD